MTTNFSHTANVGSVEEMNWPNLSGGTRTDRLISYIPQEGQASTPVGGARAGPYRRRSYWLGKPCSSRLSTLQMAATVGWESEVSLRVSSSLGISWNSRSSLAFFAASLFSHASENTHGSRACRKGKAASESFLFLFFVVWHLPGFRQQLNEMLEQRQMELVRSVEPHLRSGGNTLRPLSRKVSLSNTNFGQEQASHRASSGRTFNSHISVAAADNIFQNRTKEIFLQMFHQARKYWKKKKKKVLEGLPQSRRAGPGRRWSWG